MLDEVLKLYDLPPNTLIVNISTGLINNTYKAVSFSHAYIIQQINSRIFNHPEDIDHNLRLIAEHLKKNKPGYRLPMPIETADGQTLVIVNNKYYRAFNFVENAITYTVAETPQLAFEAANQFGSFTSQFRHFPSESLKITLPQFHDISFRYQQFLSSIKNAAEERKSESINIINELKSLVVIVDDYEKIKLDKNFIKRVTHHDTKISNVLFNEEGKGICVIDLDTVMPGYFFSDVGDMMRTYLPPVSEEEQDLSKVFIREDYFTAIANGYLQHMQQHLSENEIKAFVYAGKFMIYMQALRFITDYLNNDVYYGAKNDKHNFNRAQNQLTLLKDLLRHEDRLNDYIRRNFLS